MMKQPPSRRPIVRKIEGRSAISRSGSTLPSPILPVSSPARGSVTSLRVAPPASSAPRQRAKSVDDVLEETLDERRRGPLPPRAAPREPMQSVDLEETVNERRNAYLPPPAAPRERAKSLHELIEETIDEMRGADAARRAPASASDGAIPEVGRVTAISTGAVVVDAFREAPPHAPPARAARRSAKRAVSAAALAVAVALVLVGTFGKRGWPASPRAAAPALAAAVDVPATAPPCVIDVAVLPVAPAPITTSQPPPTTGRIQVTTGGRRVVLDGRAAGKGPQTLTVSCGRHQVQIIGGGALQSIDVPCGGEVAVGPSK